LAIKAFENHINGITDIREYICQMESEGIPQECIEKIDKQEHKI